MGNNGYARIEYKGDVGYVSVAFLDIELEEMGTLVTSTDTMLEKTPSSGSAYSFCTIPSGMTVVYYEDVENNFSMVGYGGHIGFVRSKDLW